MATGKGSYGSVYEARAKDTEERVAIKVIPVGDNDDIEDIQKEIDMLKECHHPNVVQYLVSCRIAALQNDVSAGHIDCSALCCLACMLRPWPSRTSLARRYNQQGSKRSSLALRNCSVSYLQSVASVTPFRSIAA